MTPWLQGRSRYMNDPFLAWRPGAIETHTMPDAMPGSKQLGQSPREQRYLGRIIISREDFIKYRREFSRQAGRVGNTFFGDARAG